MYYFEEYDRIMMWHEAGHAVAAMHYGRKVFSLGLDPLPHCLVNSLFMSRHDKGVMLCAGAAMTNIVYGTEYGGDCTDWAMAAELGDLELFKAEAELLCHAYTAEAQFLVNSRVDGPDEYPDMPIPIDSAISEPMWRAAAKARMPRWIAVVLNAWANRQIKKYGEDEI